MALRLISIIVMHKSCHFIKNNPIYFFIFIKYSLRCTRFYPKYAFKAYKAVFAIQNPTVDLANLIQKYVSFIKKIKLINKRLNEHGILAP